MRLSAALAKVADFASLLSTPRWGVALKQPKGLAQCAPPNECLWADFGGAAHHLSFSADRESFESNRVGDGEIVLGARVH